MKRASGRVTWAFAAALMAAACGGGNGASNSPGGGQPDGGPVTGGSGGPWLFYSGAGVFAVDSSAPSAAPVAVQQLGNTDGLRVVDRGTWSATTGQPSALEVHSAIWTAGGRIWRASAAAGAVPAPAQVSNESNIGDPSPLTSTANHLCETSVVEDWANPDDSRFFYRLAGSDKACGGADDVVKSVRLGSAATDAPVVAPGKRIAPIQAPATGALTGWLVLDTLNRLVKTDAAFASPTTLVASSSFAIPVARTATQLLVLIQSGTRSAVQRFDPGSGTLDPTLLFTLPGGSFSTVAASAQDAASVYIVAIDGGTFAQSLWRLPLAATQADSAVQMTAESGRTVNGLLHLTTNKVAFVARTTSTTNDSLVAVDKSASGTTPAPALGTVAPAGTALTVIAAAADKVYVNSTGASGRAAQAVGESGTAVISQASAQWVGFAGSGTAVLATGVSSAGSFSGAALATVVASSAAAGVSLGTLPAGIDSMDRLRLSADKGLERAFTKDGNGGTFGEVFFLDAAAAGSLLRVTNTPAISESVP